MRLRQGNSEKGCSSSVFLAVRRLFARCFSNPTIPSSTSSLVIAKQLVMVALRCAASFAACFLSDLDDLPFIRVDNVPKFFLLYALGDMPPSLIEGKVDVPTRGLRLLEGLSNSPEAPNLRLPPLRLLTLSLPLADLADKLSPR